MNEFSKLEEAIKDSNEAYNKRKKELDKLQKVRPRPVEENDTLAFSEMISSYQSTAGPGKKRKKFKVRKRKKRAKSHRK